MSIHWKDLDAAGKVAAIASIYEPGMSGKKIAEHFEGATRNAVIGFYDRHRDKLTQWPLLAAGGYDTDRPRKARETKSPTIKRSGITKMFMGAKEDTAPKPLPAPRVVSYDAHLCGKPMMMLKDKIVECRWPVNEAKVGEGHLFCGLPSEGSFCTHHKMRSLMPPRQSQAGARR